MYNMKFKNWLLKENFENFPEGPRKKYAIQASLISKYDKNILLKDDNDEVVGIASVWKEPDTANSEGIPEGNYIKIRNMSVKEKGLGKKLFQMIKDYAKSHNAGIYLNSTEGAYYFYENQGMHRATGANYYLTADEI